jgi:ribosomal protein S18 acetylase RimI-like enzyme
MENNIEIKAVQSNELPILIQIARDTFIHNYAHLNDPVYFQQYLDRSFELTQFQAEWADPHTLFYWAIVDGIHAGYCKFRTEATVEGLEEAGNQVLEIQRIYVLDSHQKLGLGKRMLEKAIEIARQKGYSWIWLGVWKDNPKAIAWYQAQGFEAFGEHIFWMGEDPQTDWLMRKKV